MRQARNLGNEGKGMAQAFLRTLLKDTAYKAATSILGDGDGLVRLPVISGPARGLHFRLDLVHRKEAYFWGKYDRSLIERVAPIIRPGWVVWDCGTYIGFYTGIFGRLVGPSGTVVAIEPDPRNLRRTRENMKLNGLSNIRYENVAVGKPCGEAEFLLSDNSNSHLPGYHVGGDKHKWLSAEAQLKTIRIPCLSLDQLYLERSLPKPNLIKLDIEGAEKDGLSFADRLVNEVRPLIVLELHNRECDAAAWHFSQNAGYRIISLDSGLPIVRKEDVMGTLLLQQ
jgi:FkbM family methyltransferase